MSRFLMSRFLHLAIAALFVAALPACEDDNPAGGAGTGGAGDPPVALDVSVMTRPGVAISAELPATDPDGDPLTFIVSESPARGIVTLVDNGGTTTATYTPEAGFAGVDVFKFRVSDGQNTADGTVTIEVVNGAPSVVSVADRVPEEGISSITISGSDPDDDPLTFEVVLEPTLGSIVSVTGTGSSSATIEYQPSTILPVGGLTDVFTYRASDGIAESTIGEVTVEINAKPAVPGGAGGALNLEVPHGDDLTFDLPGADPDGGEVTFELVDPPAHGTLTGLNEPGAAIKFEAEGSEGPDVTYTPDEGFVGMDMFTYKILDDLDMSDPIKVILIVTNEAPEATGDEVVTDKGTGVTVTLAGTDADGDDLTFVIAEGPDNGTLGPVTPVDATSSTVLYTPNAGFSGMDEFSFTADDGFGPSEPAGIGVTVLNEAPSATSQGVETMVGMSIQITLEGTDPDGDPLIFAIDQDPLNGALGPVVPTGPTTATVDYTPDSNFIGSDGFSFTVNDGTETSGPGAVTIEVVSEPFLAYLTTPFVGFAPFDESLGVVDSRTQDLFARFDVGDEDLLPTNSMAVSPDGRTGYVPLISLDVFEGRFLRAADSGAALIDPEEDAGGVRVIDLTTGAILDDILLQLHDDVEIQAGFAGFIGSDPFIPISVEASPDGRFLYVGAVHESLVGHGHHGLPFADGAAGFANNIGGCLTDGAAGSANNIGGCFGPPPYIFIVDTATNEVLHGFPAFVEPPDQFQVAPSIVSPEDGALGELARRAGSPLASSIGEGIPVPHNLAVSPDGSTVYALLSSYYFDSVYGLFVLAYDVTGDEEEPGEHGGLALIDPNVIGSLVGDIQITPDGQRLVVTAGYLGDECCEEDHDTSLIYILDAETLEVLFEADPDLDTSFGFAISADSRFAYVTGHIVDYYESEEAEHHELTSAVVKVDLMTGEIVDVVVDLVTRIWYDHHDDLEVEGDGFTAFDAAISPDGNLIYVLTLPTQIEEEEDFMARIIVINTGSMEVIGQFDLFDIFPLFLDMGLNVF